MLYKIPKKKTSFKIETLENEPVKPIENSSKAFVHIVTPTEDSSVALELNYHVKNQTVLSTRRIIKAAG